MSEQIFYEDVNIGDELPPLTKQPDTRQLVMWAGASGDYNPIHYDKEFAQSKGLSGVIVQGQLVGCFLGQLVTGWMGKEGTLQKLTCSYKEMNFPGEAITCKGKVLKKNIEDGKYLVVCSVWAENPKGEKTVTGTATVAMPSKG